MGPRHHLDRWDYAGEPLAGTKDDPVSAIADTFDLMNAPDFRFKIGVGSGRDGYDTVEIRSDGSCEYTFYEIVHVRGSDNAIAYKEHRRRAKFTIDQESLVTLRKLLADTDFLRLQKVYYANVADGAQEWAMVEVGGKRKIVYCDNHFPASFRKLRRFIFGEIIGSYPDQLEKAPVVEITRAELEAELHP